MELVKDRFKYQKVAQSFMSEQINLRFSKELLEMARSYAKEQGYLNVQELMREALREKITKDKKSCSCLIINFEN
jgi:predicted DNA binding CopG/RHH family protein